MPIARARAISRNGMGAEVVVKEALVGGAVVKPLD